MKLHSCADFREGAPPASLCKSNSYFTPRRICFSVGGRGVADAAPTVSFPGSVAVAGLRNSERRHAVPLQYMSGVSSVQDADALASGTQRDSSLVRLTPTNSWTTVRTEVCHSAVSSCFLAWVLLLPNRASRNNCVHWT